MTIPPMEFPPSRATNAAVPVPPGSDPELTVEPDDTDVEDGTTASDDVAAVDPRTDRDR